MRDYTKLADEAFALFKDAYEKIPEGNLESNNCIERANAVTRNWAANVIKGFEAAKERADSDEKKVRLADAIVKEVSQIIFVLFRRALLTEDMEKRFRGLPLFEETDDSVAYFVARRDEEVQRILAERNKVQKEQRELDIFQAIATQGMSPEQAEEQMKKYEEKQAQALGV